MARLLRGGELLLTTGVLLPQETSGLAAYVEDLADAGVTGLMVEVGRRFDRLPDGMVEVAERRGLVLVELAREVRFAAITEQVHARIVDAQLAELRLSDEVHAAFTELTVEGAPPTEIVRQVARMAGRPVVLENLAHQVLAVDAAGRDLASVLDGWEDRSRAVRVPERTGFDAASGWLLTTVGARGQDWGRLVLLTDDSPSARDSMLLERGAATVALSRLVERDRESLERQSHRTLLTGLISGSVPLAETSARSQALGVPARRACARGRARAARGRPDRAGARGAGAAARLRRVGVRRRARHPCGRARRRRRRRDRGRAALAAAARGRRPRARAAVDGARQACDDRARARRRRRVGDGRGLGGRGGARRTPGLPRGRAGRRRRSVGRGRRSPAVLPAPRRAAARAAAPAARRRPSADLRRARAGAAAGPRRAARPRTSSASCASTSPPGATSRPRPTRRTCRDRRSTSGCTASSGSSPSTSTPSSRACRCTWPCSASTPSVGSRGQSAGGAGSEPSAWTPSALSLHLHAPRPRRSRPHSRRAPPRRCAASWRSPRRRRRPPRGRVHRPCALASGRRGRDGGRPDPALARAARGAGARRQRQARAPRRAGCRRAPALGCGGAARPPEPVARDVGRPAPRPCLGGRVPDAARCIGCRRAALGGRRRGRIGRVPRSTGSAWLGAGVRVVVTSVMVGSSSVGAAPVVGAVQHLPARP